MGSDKPGEQALKKQVDFLLDQLRQNTITIHQFMQLLGMAYGDYLDFHPEERPGEYERRQLEKAFKYCGPDIRSS